jgi:hypothetical protein
MTKSNITRLFAGAITAVVVGSIIGIVGVVAALANGAVVIRGSEVVTLSGGPFAWAIAALLVASLLLVAGTVAAVASWVGALLNTYRLDDKTWFVVLLVTGIVSLGWVAMIVYVFAGPDSTAQDATPSARALSRTEAPLDTDN